MTVEEFLAWAEEQEGKFELEDGVVVAMAPERLSHGDVKGEIFARLREAIRAAKLPCRAFVDSVGVRVEPDTFYQPDVLVRCGPPLPGDAYFVPDPVIIVQVLSPSTAYRDTGRKVVDYFRFETLRHYLIVHPDNRIIYHHERRDAGLVLIHLIRDGAFSLDPPGIAVENLFADLSPEPDPTA
jgi:Uma2 family endonuclease